MEGAVFIFLIIKICGIIEQIPVKREAMKIRFMSFAIEIDNRENTSMEKFIKIIFLRGNKSVQ